MRLAAMLATGEHNGEKDLTTALMWYQIAYSFGAENASHSADMVKKALDSKQIETATARARQYKPPQRHSANAFRSTVIPII